MTNRGMLSVEYAILITILIAALLAMSSYIQKKICGKIRDSGDAFGYGRQYEPK